MSLKWYFNASPKALGTQGTSYSIGFTSAGTHFSVLRNGTVFKEKFYLYYDDTQAYKSGWINSAYRTVTFDEEPTGALLTYLEANATAVAEDPYKFKQLHKNTSLIGTGAYRFRPYTVAEPRLATPTNVAVDGTTVSWDDVANAESYDIYIDGTLYENTTGEASSPLTVSYLNWNGSSYVTMTATAGQTKSFSTGGSAYGDDTEDFTCSGGNGTYTYTLTKISGDEYCTVEQNKNVFTVKMGSSATELTGGKYVFVISSGSDSVTINLDYEFQCLTGDTLIMLSDGTQKRIDEITTADKVLSINPETNELEADEIIYSDSAENKTHTEYDIYTLSDGTEIKTVHRHRFYNMERQSMVYMDEWDIGEHFIKIDGSTPMLIAHKNVIETAKHYTIFTRKNQNYFANGLLSGNRHTKKMNIGGDKNE